MAARSLRLANVLMRRMEVSIEQHAAAALAGFALSQWLALRLQLLSAVLVAALAFLAVAGPHGQVPGAPAYLPQWITL